MAPRRRPTAAHSGYSRSVVGVHATALILAAARPRRTIGVLGVADDLSVVDMAGEKRVPSSSLVIFGRSWLVCTSPNQRFQATPGPRFSRWPFCVEDGVVHHKKMPSVSWRATQSALRSAGVGCLALLAPVGPAWASVCPNESLRAELDSVELPDCRAYELVSPAIKYGWPVSLSQVSSDGDRAIALSLGGLPGSDQIALLNYYELVREPEGWKTAPLNMPTGYVTPGGPTLLAASPDLSHGLFEYRSSAIADARNTAFYVRGLPGGSLEEAGPRISLAALQSTPASDTLNSSVPSVSGDMSHVLFTLNGPEYVFEELLDYVWPGDTTALRQSGVGWTSLYEYGGTTGPAPLLVGVDGGGRLISQCGTSLGYPSGGRFTALQADELYNALSTPDGSRIFFTVAAGPCGEGAGPPVNELYAREEYSAGVWRTVAISEPTSGPGGDCSACAVADPQDAVFQGASEDGSKVFFLSWQRLLKGAEGQNLYEYDFDAQSGLKVLLVAPNVQGVARVAENGSRVYFVAQGVLTLAANPVGDVARAGADNLYAYDTRTAESSFVGGLAAGDERDWQTEDNRPVDVTPDGRFLVFSSSADLTPGDGSSSPQVFEYDSHTNTLVQVSRVQGGRGGEFAAEIANPNYTGSVDPSAQWTSVSNDGSVVVFQSEAALTPHAIVGYVNVYEYQDGRVSLISDGQDRSIGPGGIDSVSLLGVDGSGRDIFFTTADRLAPQDGDTQEDVYDARVGGGFLTTPRAACEGDGCQGGLAGDPSFAVPGSLSQPVGKRVPAPAVKPVAKAKAKRKAMRAKGRRKVRKVKGRPKVRKVKPKHKARRERA